MTNKKYSVGFIILCLIFFYPVGIYLIICNVLHSSSQKTENSRTASYTDPLNKGNINKRKKNPGRIAMIAGWVLLPIGFITLLPMLADFGEHGTGMFGFSSIFFVFIVGGGTLLSLGTNIASKEKQRRNYVRVVNNSPDLSIAAIARGVKRSEAQVLRDLNAMLADGYFPNCYIDQNKMEFCLPRVKDAKRYDYRTAAVNCNSCGAKTTLLVGTVKRCEYCGSPLTADNAKSVPTPLSPYGSGYTDSPTYAGSYGNERNQPRYNTSSNNRFDPFR